MNDIAEVEVEIFTPKDKSLGRAYVPAEAPARDIAAELAERWQLPYMQNGKRIDYHLFRKEEGRHIPGEETLSSAGVRNGERLQVVASAPVELPEKPPKEFVSIGPTDETVSVTLFLMVDGQHHNSKIVEELPRDLPVSELIEQLSAKLNLPLRENGTNITYDLVHNGTKLRLEESLRQKKVNHHDMITMAKNVTAACIELASSHRE